MADKTHNLQASFLNHVRKEKIPVVVYLTNGTRLKGVIKSFDNFMIFMQGENQQFIYKHAISTIIPEKNIDLKYEELTSE
jgi:host factor-I protein